jgi:hypothetical protein
MREVLLTFDTEDIISPSAISILQTLLKQLKTNDIKGLFFITGHMAERLSAHPQVVNMLKDHEIGYHSSGHSTHPTIFEFTDIESYEEAYKVSRIRETSHVNPLSGEVEGKGGLLAVKSLFPSKEIVSFRAPGNCWSPPHLEALRDLGIKIDFSSSIHPIRFKHKGLTFCPYPTLGDWRNESRYYRLLLLSVLRNKMTIADLHPSFFIDQEEWDSIYWGKNPAELVQPTPRKDSEVAVLLKGFETFLKRIRNFEKIGMFQITPNLQESHNEVIFTPQEVTKCYEHSIRWPRRLFHYEPKFIKKHFYNFFDVSYPE